MFLSVNILVLLVVTTTTSNRRFFKCECQQCYRDNLLNAQCLQNITCLKCIVYIDIGIWSFYDSHRHHRVMKPSVSTCPRILLLCH